MDEKADRAEQLQKRIKEVIRNDEDVSLEPLFRQQDELNQSYIGHTDSIGIWERVVINVVEGWEHGTAVILPIIFSGAVSYASHDAMLIVYCDKSPQDPDDKYLYATVKIRPPGPGGSSETVPLGDLRDLGARGWLAPAMIMSVKKLLGLPYDRKRVYV